MTRGLLTSRCICSVLAALCMLWQQMFSCCVCCSQCHELGDVAGQCCFQAASQSASCCSTHCCDPSGQDSSDNKPCCGNCSLDGPSAVTARSAAPTYSELDALPHESLPVDTAGVVVAAFCLHQRWVVPPLIQRLSMLSVWRN